MQISERGVPGGPPLVLIHGLVSSPGCWDRVVPALAERHRVILPDLMAGLRGRFSLEAAAVELATQLRQRGVTAAGVIGHSMGGLVALHLAAGSPGLVTRLVLVEVPAVTTRRRGLSRLVAIARGSLRREASAVHIVVASALRTNPFHLLAATRATLRADLGADAAATAIPTLLVWGEDDGIVPVEIGRRLAADMPSARLVVIPDVGHQPMWEAPDRFLAVVEPFLASRDQPAPGSV